MAPLHETLLRGVCVPSERRPAKRWAYPLWAILAVSVFVLYHTAVLLVWNTPGTGLAKEFHSGFLKQVRGYEYFQGTRNTQSWAMFAPNPNRTNVFVRVFVEDAEGEVWDFNQDIWEQDRYPYIWYSRRGKINRRIDNNKSFQRIYGAWVCREWERSHAGEAPKSVQFVRRMTRVPAAETVIAAGGWDQWAADAKQVEQETVTCKTAVHGTLPNELRERYGLELMDDTTAGRETAGRRPPKLVSHTWWDKQEAERKRAEKAAKRDAPPASAPPVRFIEPEPAASQEEDSPEY